MFIDLTVLAALYVTTGLLLVFTLWLYYDRRDRNRYEKTRAPTVFVCIRCRHIYAEPRGTRKAGCPRCRYPNIPLRF